MGPLSLVSLPLAFRPFLDPAPVWGVWYLLVVPLAVGIVVVWKSIKCGRMADVPREAGVLLGWILGGFALAAAALVTLVWATG